MSLFIYKMKKRFPNFNWIAYLKANPDLKDNIITEKQAFVHYINHGRYENRPLSINNSINIITSPILYSDALQIKSLLNKLHIDSIINTTITEKDLKDNDTLFIIIYSTSTVFPPKTIFWQIEQINRTDKKKDNKHIFSSNQYNLMNKALVVWEMSINNYWMNYEYNTKIHKSHVFQIQLPFSQILPLKINNFRDIDILFFGAKNDRRVRILNEIELALPNIKLVKCFGVFGKERDELLYRSKYVLNLHYYENPSLEASRLNIAINAGCFILSEDVKNDDYNCQLYSSLVKFTPTINNDFSNIVQLINFIKYNLQKETYLHNINYFDYSRKELENNCLFSLHKNLFAIETKINSKLSPDIQWNIDDTKAICLKLIENLPDRNIVFKNYPPNIPYNIFPAIKHPCGWIGCALSYQTIIRNAKQQQLSNITIFEDDCKFLDDFQNKYNIIQQFLQKYKNWDVFNGFICQLEKNSFAINSIHYYKGMTFLEINTMVGMVFNIYNSSIFDTIINWSYQNAITDPTNTYLQIDQILKNSKPRVIIAWPFPVDIHQVQSSTNIHNDKYHTLFEYEWYKNELKKTINIVDNEIAIFKNKYPSKCLHLS